MANVTILNGTSSTVGGAALFTATENCRLLISFIHSASSTITMRWGNSVNYNQVSSSDVHAIGRKLGQIYISNNETNFFFTVPLYGGYRFTKGFLAESDYAGLTTTMAYPLELYLKSGEIFDLTCDVYSISVITE